MIGGSGSLSAAQVDRLTEEEKEKLLDLAQQLVKGGKVTSVAAYGSKVAGYARPDSDYDIIVTAQKFPGRIRYKYVDSPVRASALVVEDKLFMGDAVKASLGEFVSGRLLERQPASPQPGIPEGGRGREQEEGHRRGSPRDHEPVRRVLPGPDHPAGLLPLRQAAQAGDDLPAGPLQLRQDLHLPPGGREPGEQPRRLQGGDEEAWSPRVSSAWKTASCASSRERVKRQDLREAPRALQPHLEGVRQYAVHGYAGRVGLERGQGRGALEGEEDTRRRPSPRRSSASRRTC